jgi:hypothetical protein
MGTPQDEDDALFRDAVRGLLAGDFSRLEPLFGAASPAAGTACRIVDWVEQGRFADHADALAEALTCACFLGRTGVVEVLLARGVELTAGTRTGVDGLHWAANRGQLETVRVLLARGVEVETRNMYDGTALGMAVWSAVNEPRAEHLSIVEALLDAGARVDEVCVPTGDARLDEVLRRYGAEACR